MTSRQKTAFLAVPGLILLGGLFGYLIGHLRSTSPETTVPETKDAPVAQVQTTTLRRGTIEETIRSYGSVIAAPGQTEVYSVAYENQIAQVLVTNGQEVAAGQPLVIVKPSPDMSLQWKQAQIDFEAARSQLETVQSRFDIKLATNEDLTQAQQQYNLIEEQLNSFSDRGLDTLRTLNARQSGVVSQLQVQLGQIIPAGEMLLETVNRDQMQVRLGIEGNDARHMTEGKTVRLFPVNAENDEAFTGQIVRITRVVNPETRLVDVYVRPSDPARLLLDSYIRGEIAIGSSAGLVVPRSSVLPIDGKHVLYSIQGDSVAVEHFVSIGLESDSLLEVHNSDLQDGMQIVTVGNSELHDGMSVRVVSAL